MFVIYSHNAYLCIESNYLIATNIRNSMKTTHYRIDGVNEMFRTMADAKHHVWVAYTQRERRMYLRGCMICKIVNEEVVSMTPIIVEDDSYKFGKTVRV